MRRLRRGIRLLRRGAADHRLILTQRVVVIDPTVYQHDTIGHDTIGQHDTIGRYDTIQPDGSAVGGAVGDSWVAIP